MSEAHEQQHERLEREARELERRSERLGEDIADTKQTWEAHKADESVPGAPSPEGGLPPEANYTTSGDDPPDDGDDGGGSRDAREPWPDE
jgi:hypothetical protein